MFCARETVSLPVVQFPLLGGYIGVMDEWIRVWVRTWALIQVSRTKVIWRQIAADFREATILQTTVFRS